MPTYRKVFHRLNKLGFALQPTKGKHLYFQHPNGAVILLPPVRATAKLNPLHEVMIRATLKNYGLIPDLEPSIF
jgi:predicted RNA binding protein YcfA (HicA-like mRNA interferase family)